MLELVLAACGFWEIMALSKQLEDLATVIGYVHIIILYSLYFICDCVLFVYPAGLHLLHTIPLYVHHLDYAFVSYFVLCLQ